MSLKFNAFWKKKINPSIEILSICFHYYIFYYLNHFCQIDAPKEVIDNDKS